MRFCSRWVNQFWASPAFKLATLVSPGLCATPAGARNSRNLSRAPLEWARRAGDADNCCRRVERKPCVMQSPCRKAGHLFRQIAGISSSTVYSVKWASIVRRSMACERVNEFYLGGNPLIFLMPPPLGMCRVAGFPVPCFLKGLSIESGACSFLAKGGSPDRFLFRLFFLHFARYAPSFRCECST